MLTPDVPAQLVFPLQDGVDADRLLQLEDESGADRLDDGGSASLLPQLDVMQVALGLPTHLREDEEEEEQKKRSYFIVQKYSTSHTRQLYGD